MGMDDNMLMCIRALAENRIQDAKEYAIMILPSYRFEACGKKSNSNFRR